MLAADWYAGRAKSRAAFMNNEMHAKYNTLDTVVT